MATEAKKEMEKVSRGASKTVAVTNRENLNPNFRTVGIYDNDPRMEGIGRYEQVEIQPHLANAEKSLELGHYKALRHNLLMLKEGASNHKVPLDSLLWQWIHETEASIKDAA